VPSWRVREATHATVLAGARGGGALRRGRRRRRTRQVFHSVLASVPRCEVK
jgi:hypothetical protein